MPVAKSGQTGTLGCEGGAAPQGFGPRGPSRVVVDDNSTMQRLTRGPDGGYGVGSREPVRTKVRR